MVSTENKKYKVTHYNDLCYNPANLKFGVICLNKYGDAIFSPIYITFEIDEEVDVDFLGANLTRWDFINRALRFQQGTVYERMAVSPEDFLSIQCYLPSKAEQICISSFVQSLDKRIDKQEKLVEALKKYKRGLSSSLFDEIAKGECQTVLFSDALRLLQNNTFSREDLSFDDGDVRNIHYGDVLIKYGTAVTVSEIAIPRIKPDRNIEKFSSASYLRNGDIVFADTAEDYAVGKATEIIGVTNQKLLSGLHTIPCRPHDRFAPMYLGYYFNSHYFRSQIYRMIQGIKVSSISKSEIVKTTVLIPSYDVQEKVARLLSKSEHLIEKEEKKAEALIKIKRGLMQQLFI